MGRLRRAKRDAELDAIITDENLKPEETRQFIERAFRDGAIPTDRHRDHTDPAAGITVLQQTATTAIKKQRVLDKLGEFFDRFFGLA